MSLPEPAEYSIMLNLKTALLSIAIASGYYFDVQTGAVKLDANADVETLIGTEALRPFLVIEVLPETREYSNSRPNGVRITRPIKIHWVHEPPDASDETRMQMFFRGCADVEKAIASGPDAVAYRSPATAITIGSSTLQAIGDGSLVWAVIEATVLSRHDYGAA